VESLRDRFWAPSSLISGNMLKFADDCMRLLTTRHRVKVYRDIDILSNWALRWHMKFNIDIPLLLKFTCTHCTTVLLLSLIVIIAWDTQ